MAAELINCTTQKLLMTLSFWQVGFMAFYPPRTSGPRTGTNLEIYSTLPVLIARVGSPLLLLT